MLWFLAVLMGGLGFGYVTVRRRRKGLTRSARRKRAHRFSSNEFAITCPGRASVCVPFLTTTTPLTRT